MGLAEFIGETENRGAHAVIQALKEIDVLTYDTRNSYFHFKEHDVSEEALRRLIDRHLGRST